MTFGRCHFNFLGVRSPEFNDPCHGFHGHPNERMENYSTPYPGNVSAHIEKETRRANQQERKTSLSHIEIRVCQYLYCNILV